MEDRVGDSVPTPAKLAALLKQQQDILTELKKFGTILTKDERRRLLRVRRDSEQVQRLVYSLASKRGLKIEGFPLQGMLNDLNLTQALEPFDQAMSLGKQLTTDTIMQADTEAWQAFLAHYGVLSAMASHDAELARELQPVVDFMKTGRRKPEPAPETDEK